jgi:two-component system nitrate/nitrite sensor histidine kinase NarX
LAVFDIKPTDYDPQEIAVLQIFAARAGAELERKRAEDKLNQLNAQLKDYNLHLEQVVAERTHEIERRHRVTECLRDMVAILNSNRPLSEILDYILATSTQLLGTPSGAIYSLDADQKTLSVQATCGLPTAYATALKFSVEQSFLGQAILQRQPMVISNWGAMLDAQPVELDGVKRTLLAQNYQTLLAIPLLRQSNTSEEHEVYGGIALYYATERTFTDEEIGLAVAFGDQAALAIQNTRLHAQVEQMAVTEERNRLARELHDSVTQSLYSLTLLAEGYRRMANAGRLTNIEEALIELGEIGQQALKEMRLLVYELRPPSLERAGLLGALHERLQTVEKRAGVEARLIATDHLLHLPMAIETGLYRIAQEALNNALKHAAATAVTVQLGASPQWVQLEVIDNGRGFDLATVAENRGIGVSSMQERTEKLGGTLTLHSAPGQGSRVCVRVPLAQ